MKSKKILALPIGVLIAVALYLAQPASAVTLIPPSLEFVDVKPGETIMTKVKLFNETAENLTLYSSTANFTALDETGTPKVLSEDVQTDLAGWITLGKGPFTLTSGERREIPTEIVIPANATPGGHYATILFSPQKPEPTGGGQVAISSKIGTLVLVRVAGIINESGSIAEFAAATHKSKFSRLPIDFLLRFQNRGNVHLRPVGNLTIRNMLGGTSAVVPMNASQGAVLPQSIRKFDLVWEKEANAETRGNFFTELGQEWSNFALGPYMANVELSYGLAKEKTAVATLKLWVFPWRILLVSLLILVLIVLLVIFFLKRYNRWIIAKANPQAPKKP